MPETLLTIQEAAAISGKSIQTIRRAVKAKKVHTRKKKTPQGFNYLIIQESLVDFYKLKNISFNREHGAIKEEKKSDKNLSTEFATIQDLKKFQNTIEDLLGNHKKEKESFMRFMKAFQDRFVVLENQLKLLEQPKKKWFQFWR